VAGEIYFPNEIGCTDEQITVMDDNTVLFRPAFARGVVQANNFGGPRLTLQRIMQVNNSDDRSKLFAFLAAVRGKQRPFWSTVNYKMRGAFASAELLTNNFLRSGTTGWSATSGAISNYAAILRAISSSTVQFGATDSPGSLTSGYAYAARAAIIVGKNGGNWTCGPDLTDNLSVSATSYSNGSGVKTAVLTATGTGTGTFGVYANPGTVASGDFFDIWMASVSRCFLVDGANQSGSSLNVKAIQPASTNGLLYPGDLVEINGELKICTAPLSSDGSSKGFLIFEPEMVASPPDGAAIVVVNPMSKWVAASDPVITNQYGLYAQVQIQMEQVY